MGTVEGHCDPRFAEVREIFEKSFADGEELGASIAFCLDGEMVVDLWGGHRDVAQTQPWTRDTLVNTYSTTKGMTAICAHQLVERGLLDLDAPVATYWPEFAAKDKGAIPVRWLLSHQAGLPAVRKLLAQETLYDWDAMAAALAEQEPWWEPGTRHGYHALTFGHLVGEVIRRASGKSVGTFFRENVAGPLGADFHIGLAAADDARTEQVFGPDAVLGGLPMRFGLGFMLRQDFMPISPNANAFGHPGAGGSIGMADPDARVGFGYVMNKMKLGLVGGPGAFAVLRRFFELL